jgi:hypothetical protein
MNTCLLLSYRLLKMMRLTEKLAFIDFYQPLFQWHRPLLGDRKALGARINVVEFEILIRSTFNTDAAEPIHR